MEKVLCLHWFHPVYYPSFLDTHTMTRGIVTHWKKTDFCLKNIEKKASKCQTTILNDSRNKLKDWNLDNLSNHLNLQIKPSPAAARLLFRQTKHCFCPVWSQLCISMRTMTCLEPPAVKNIMGSSSPKHNHSSHDWVYVHKLVQKGPDHYQWLSTSTKLLSRHEIRLLQQTLLS